LWGYATHPDKLIKKMGTRRWAGEHQKREEVGWGGGRKKKWGGKKNIGMSCRKITFPSG